MARLIFPIVLGLSGLAVLLSLGVWQVQRLGEKQGILAEIDAMIVEAPVPLPPDPRDPKDRYLSVTATGDLGSDEIHVLVSAKGYGAGYRVIRALAMPGDRRVLVDLGFLPLEAKDSSRPAGSVTVIGNLHWPSEIDSFTPEPDAARAIWFARDVPALAATLNTEPTLIIARSLSRADLGTTPFPVDTSTIPNDHLQYAITWFSLAAVWLGMTLLWMWRIRRKTD